MDPVSGNFFRSIMAEKVDAVVIGAGVVGLAVARALAVRGREVLVLERNGAIGEETSSRNSEVIHAGIYYAPGSLKARLCRAGKEMLYAYARERGIGHRRCGKLIVAVHENQTEKLNHILECAQANQVNDLRLMSADECAVMEPEVRAARGLFSPSTGIIDSHALMTSLHGDLEYHGGVVAFNTDVEALDLEDGGLAVRTGGAEGLVLKPEILINAAGLGAQGLVSGFSLAPPALRCAIGHYYALSGKAPFDHLVYPVPEDGGLGVHVTLDLGGQVKFGPDVRWIDHVDYRFDDSRRSDFIKAISAYYPGLDPARLQPAYTGIRPKLSGPGEPAADFRIDGPEHHGIPGLVNLFGIESPGLTAALAIGEEVTSRLGL
jgi:L-2-hydroxyglutarate oxidase LhgO